MYIYKYIYIHIYMYIYIEQIFKNLVLNRWSEKVDRFEFEDTFNFIHYPHKFTIRSKL